MSYRQPKLYPVVWRVTDDESSPPVTIEACVPKENVRRFAIRSKGYCLNKYGHWEPELRPGEKDDRFQERCRYMTKENALTVYERTVEKREYERKIKESVLETDPPVKTEVQRLIEMAVFSFDPNTDPTEEELNERVQQIKRRLPRRPLPSKLEPQTSDDPGGIEARQAIEDSKELSRIKELRSVHKQRFLRELVELCQKHNVYMDIYDEQTDPVPHPPAFTGQADRDGRQWKVSVVDIEKALREDDRS